MSEYKCRTCNWNGEVDPEYERCPKCGNPVYKGEWEWLDE